MQITSIVQPPQIEDQRVQKAMKCVYVCVKARHLATPFPTGILEINKN
jgi:hypothetical protein